MPTKDTPITPVQMINFENVRITEDERCVVCDAMIPAGAWAVPASAGHVCSAGCIASTLGEALRDPAMLYKRACEAEYEADDLEEEARGLREKAEQLNERAAEAKHRQRLVQGSPLAYGGQR